MNNREQHAIERYLRNKNYRIVDIDKDFDFVCVEDGHLVFINVEVSYSTNEDQFDRAMIEKKAIDWLFDNNDYTDMPLRFDNIILVPLGDKAFVKHHINALGCA